MTGMLAGRLSAPALLLLTAAAPVPVAPLPDTLTTMLREAHPAERRAIVNVAKRLYPGSAEQIDEIIRQIDREQRASIAGAGFTRGWKGEVTLGGFLSSGNTDEWGVSVSAAAKRKGPRWTHEFDLRLEMKEEDQARTEERAYAKYTVRRALGMPRLFAFGRLSFEHDRFSGIDQRYFESVGLGYQLLDGRSSKWDIMAGPAFRQTDYSKRDSAQEPAIFARTKLDWEITDRLRFSEEADAGLAKGNSTFTSTTALTSNLYGTLSGRLSFGVEVETNPPPGRESTDMYGRASLVYDF